MLAVAATFALPALALAQTDARPIVVVFSFTNNALGKDHADYDGMSKGVQDLLITDLAREREDPPRRPRAPAGPARPSRI